MELWSGWRKKYFNFSRLYIGNNMWTCKKCGREFKRKNQSHSCLKIGSVEEYLREFPEEKRKILVKIREIIKLNFKDSEESIKWNMPTYKKDNKIIHLAFYKNHIGLFLGQELLGSFKERLSKYESKNGTIKINYDEEIPYLLIEEMIKFLDRT